jgi:hypothetical protein
MNTIKYCILFLVVIILFACVGEYRCANEWLRPGLKGYTYIQADSMIVKRYQKGSNFQVIIDSAFLTYPIPVLSPADTTYYFDNDIIDGEHDVKLINPFDNKTVLISDLKYDIREGKKTWGCTRQEGCSSPVISYNRDGTPVTISANPQLVRVVISK